MTCPKCHREACPNAEHGRGKAWDADRLRDALDCECARSARLERERDEAVKALDYSRDAMQSLVDSENAALARATAAEARAAKLATVARGLGEALEAVESAAAMTQAHEMGVLPYETSASTAALAWERADRLRAVALAAWRELEGA